jgi:hypothetical protein
MVVVLATGSNSPGWERAARVRCQIKSLSLILLVALTTIATGAWAQSIEIRHQWQGTSAFMRQPEQVVASTMAEWRSLWARVGARAPDMFEPGRTNAVGIFLGLRNGPGYGVNVLSAVRRRDRIMLVFEERGPPSYMMAQRVAPPPAPRPVAGGPSFAGPGFAGPGFAGPGNNFAPPSAALLAPPPAPASRPALGPPTSPWAIVLLNRADLPVTVEQRLFR